MILQSSRDSSLTHNQPVETSPASSHSSLGAVGVVTKETAKGSERKSVPVPSWAGASRRSPPPQGLDGEKPLTTETAQKVTRAVFHQFQKPSHESSMEPRLSQRIGSLSASGEIFGHSYPFTLSYTFLHSLCQSHRFTLSFATIHSVSLIHLLHHSHSFTLTFKLIHFVSLLCSLSLLHSLSHIHSLCQSHPFTPSTTIQSISLIYSLCLIHSFIESVCTCI